MIRLKSAEFLVSMALLRNRSDIFAGLLTNLNLIERLWKYSKNVLQVYYEKKEKFKWKIKEFFEKDVKDKLIKLELKTFIGTKFQIING
ncbi:MAG: hypothetical protein ACP5F2_03950 [Athalassotoga sp.]|uniref:hypothetical protein n=1 Tax=Athalassotoga sp. TaxID=2022597 RepID=UPI003D070BE4